jgi:hypothetical protein
MTSSNIAKLSVDGLYTLFLFDNLTIRFRTSRHLTAYKNVKKWDNGYIVVTAIYDTLGEVEEYIDLTSVLHNLMIDSEKFLKPIKEVQII